MRREIMKCSTLFKTIPAVLLGIVMGVVSTPAFAVDELGIFELEGDAVDSNFPTLPDDWETLFDNGGSATITTDPKADGGNIVIEDPAPVSIFTMGGSKDPHFIADWAHKHGAVPDKDDITNAYAANYKAPGSGDQIIYFGADRFSNDGDAVMGFWFFQEDVKTLPDGTFDGEHQNGDVFVIANFTGGGLTVTAEILEWDAVTCSKLLHKKDPDCAAENLLIRIPQTDAKCVNPSSSQEVCAITNPDGTETSPWPYIPKSGTPGVFPEASFYEGGFNVTHIFGGERCFSSFMAESRSSSSPTAQLKDFVLGAFDVCSVLATKICENDKFVDDAPGSLEFDIRGCAENNGAADITAISLLNSIVGVNQPKDYVPSDLNWYVPPSAFDPVTDCSNYVKLKNVTDNVTPLDTPSAYVLSAGDALVYYFSETTELTQPSDEVAIDAVGAADASPIEASTAPATCPQYLFPAGLSVTKSCRSNLEDQGDRLVVVIDVEGQVCNEGDIELTGLFLEDSPTFDYYELVSTTLQPKGDQDECTTYTGHYYPTVMPPENTCPFTDTVTAKAYADPLYADPAGCAVVGGLIECTATSNSPVCLLRVTGDGDCATGPVNPSVQ
jgi:hypothetical protein